MQLVLVAGGWEVVLVAGQSQGSGGSRRQGKGTGGQRASLALEWMGAAWWVVVVAMEWPEVAW